MIDFKVTTQMHPERIERAVEKAAFRNFGHAAASIAKDVKSTLQTAEGPSASGTPPHTHKGAFLRRSIRFAYDKAAQEAVVGPMESVVGTVGEAHEKGKMYRGQLYPERPFAVPALERAVPRFAADWEGSIGG